MVYHSIFLFLVPIFFSSVCTYVVRAKRTTVQGRTDVGAGEKIAYMITCLFVCFLQYLPSLHIISN